jgi:hypothetical protein
MEELLGFYARGRRAAAVRAKCSSAAEQSAAEQSACSPARAFEAGIELALRFLLASPQFVFRFESEPGAGDTTATRAATTPGVFAVSDLDLASRLSFFLWSSLPDVELLEAAQSGRLSDAQEIRRQVRRMLADARSKALVENFAGQWLYLRNLANTVPDPSSFPDFDDNLRRSMRTETELLFESLLREDRSVVELLTADYTFLDERLARHYGVPGVYGARFRRVAVSDPNRRGLLGHASILTVTSYATRTSPVLRGKWILTNLLGSPPPAPPPDVPELADADHAKPATMRERLAQHRENASCASCHAKMDPLGFGLENFDAIGRWRTADAEGFPIDASDVLPDGSEFDDPAELRAALLARPEVFVATVAEKLLTYALGRGLSYTDMPAVRAIVREAAREEYRFSALIDAITRSEPFRMKSSPAPATPVVTAAKEPS